MIVYLLLMTAIAVGPYKTREQAQHYLTVLPGKFEVYKAFLHNTKDPELQVRLKELAYHFWCVETDDKYREKDYYGERGIINKDLQDENFKKELER